jgi:predicted dehydrogenase
MKKIYGIGILGCGDFLRWQSDAITSSPHIKVKKCFDPNITRAAKYAAQLGATVASSEDDIFSDPEVDIVCLFVPPFLRKEMIAKAVAAGKHIIATKPLAPTLKEADEIKTIVGDKVRFCVIYRRSGDAMIKTLREIFNQGELGQCALYRQDWLHHYPAWNTWALDPEKNGGPFMDAMIHNQNIARYLMDGPAKQVSFFSDNLAHPDLKCTDTDMMKMDFVGGGAAYLFITWAADLAVHSSEGNDREHIDIFYIVTDKGWRITSEHNDGRQVIVASRKGEKKIFPIVGYDHPTYERFALALNANEPMPKDFASLNESCEDISIIFAGKEKAQHTYPLNVS